MFRTALRSTTSPTNRHKTTVRDGQLVQPLRKWMAALTACAVSLSVITASAAPAQADRRSDDLAKALAAIAILGIVVHEASKTDDRPAPRPSPSHGPRQDDWHHPRTDLGYDHDPRVPSVCAIQIEGDRRDVTVYAGRCLREEGFRYQLPDYCARDIRIYGQRDKIYSEDCLRDAGFRVDGRRYGRHERPD